ncbi:MAG: hypothetical protein IJZ53_10790 [Tyzzerella sp.]|nr:hypothetical protein [Tyzzerella sp.]
MAYSGFLVKVGDYELPLKFIKADSYSVYRNTQELDSYRDANGKLHRSALEHMPNKVEFDTVSMLTNVQFEEFMSNIRNQYTSTVERKASVTLYIPEINDYVTQDMYMPDIQPTIYLANNEIIKYNSVHVSFIGY